MKISQNYWYLLRLLMVETKKQMQNTSLHIKLMKQKTRPLFMELPQIIEFINIVEKTHSMSFVMENKELLETI